MKKPAIRYEYVTLEQDETAILMEQIRKEEEPKLPKREELNFLSGREYGPWKYRNNP